MLLVVDNGSIYTKNLIDLLSKKKVFFTNLPYHNISHSQLREFDSIILSGRRKNDPQMNAINSQVIKHAILEKKPLFGICYGAEILALTLGGSIRKTESIRKGIQKIDVIRKNPLCHGTIRVFESHHYEISRLNSSLTCIAESENCTYEIIQHNDLDIFGTQFHPEMSYDGRSMIEAFVLI